MSHEVIVGHYGSVRFLDILRAFTPRRRAEEGRRTVGSRAFGLLVAVDRPQRLFRLIDGLESAISQMASPLRPRFEGSYMGRLFVAVGCRTFGVGIKPKAQPSTERANWFGESLKVAV